MNRRTSKFLPLILSACVLSGSVFFSSCSKDDDAVEPGTEFDGGTVEQNKEKLEQNALTLVGDLKELKDLEAIEATSSLVAFIDEAGFPGLGEDEEEFESAGRVMTVVRSLAGLKTGKSTPSDVLRSARAKDEILVEDKFDENTGTYSWNDNTNDWDYSSLPADAIVFEFPSIENGTSNNAEFKIFGLKVAEFENEEAETSGDLPTALKAELSVDGDVLVAYDLEASYKANGEPTSVKTSLEVAPFKFAVTVTNTTSKVGASYALTKNNANLIAFGAEAEGDFSSGSIDNEESEINDILYSSNAYVQVLNIKLEADVDVKGLYPVMDAAETPAQEAKAMNDYTNVKFYYADSGRKIADVEFYSYEDDWGGYVDLRLIFADGSKQDIATYTETGFSDLQDEIEALLEDLEGDLETEEEAGA